MPKRKETPAAHDELAYTVLREAYSLGGYVGAHVVHGLTEENAQQLYAWCVMWGHRCTVPVCTGKNKWSVTVRIQIKR